VIDIKGLGVKLGNFKLNNITFNVQRGEYFVLLGPAGAGKTVLIETIAGLNNVESGQIWIDGCEVTHVPPEKRGISIAYQDHALFPHLSVLENITFGLRQQGISKKEALEKIVWVVDLLHISNLLGRKPNTLSGGESQKVALARALAVRPNVLLLDEPLSSLDPDTRETVQQEIGTVHRKLDLTIIHVTHDFEEAVSLGDRIAVLDAGSIMQTGTVEDLFRRPNSELVARFLMARNIFQGDVGSSEGVNQVIDINGTKIPVITSLRGNHHACIRPEDVLISTKAINDNTHAFFKGKVKCVSNKGAVVNVTVDVPPEFVSLLTRREFEMIHPMEGDEVFVGFDIRAMHVF